MMTMGVAVEVARGADVLRGVYDVGDIGEADRRAVVVTDHQRPVFVRVRDLVVGEDVRGDQVVGELARRLMGVLQAEHGLHVLQCESHSC